MSKHLKFWISHGKNNLVLKSRRQYSLSLSPGQGLSFDNTPPHCKSPAPLLVVMEVSLVLQLPHSNCYTSTTSSSQSLFYRSSTSVKLRTSCSNKRQGRIKASRLKQEEKVAARDMMIDFGRYKGKMLGTLPSTYLMWVSNNLRAQDFHLNWSVLADQVLADPVYRDRIEWEFAQKLLNGDVKSDMATNTSNGGVAELLAEISKRFGWDNDDKLGWSRIDFALLGTSKGKPIPRKMDISTIKKEKSDAEKCVDVGDQDLIGSSNKRLERRERLRMKRSSGRGEDKEKIRTSSGSGDDHGMMIKKSHISSTVNTSPCPFPGRTSFSIKGVNETKKH